MFDYTFGGIRCKISLLFPAVLLCLLLVDTSGYAASGFLAALLHECGHITAAFILNTPPKEMVLSCFGIRMTLSCETKQSVWDSLLIALAGPFVNAVCAIIVYWLVGDSVHTAIHCVLAIMNLLPVLPLDGARILESVFCLCHIPHDIQNHLLNLIFWLIWAPLTALAVLLVFHHNHNITLLLVTGYLLCIKLFYK